MAGKITLDDLRSKLLDPNTSEEELAQYFCPDPESAAPFAGNIALNPETVETEIAKVKNRRAAGLLSLANSAARLRRRVAFDARIADGKYRGPVIVSEGDSWFQYPIILKDTIDWLSDEFAILSLDAAGDTMLNMARKSEFMAPIEKFGASILLFSAGGNDLLASGSLARHLGAYSPGTTVSKLLLPSFDALVGSVLVNYRRIFTQVTSRHRDVSIIVHGYDDVIPVEGGKWLGSVLSDANIVDTELQRAVVREMMTRFNRGLAALAEQFDRVTYLDLRGVVGERWHDELHPTNDGYKDVAKEFRAAIDDVASASHAPKNSARGSAAPRAQAGPRGLSLHIGVNAVDRAQYHGDFADLKAAEFDAMDMETLAKAAGFEGSKLLLGTQATRGNVMKSFSSLASHARAGDLVLITYAGHGSQLPDFSGDEDEGADETWCLYDDQLVDDEIWKLLGAFKPGVRVLMISDSCHSGSVARSVEGRSVPFSAADSGDVPAELSRALPPMAAALTYRAHADIFDRRQADLAAEGWRMRGAENLLPIAASVRLLSACTDAQFAFDGVANGHFTDQLKRTWARGGFQGNYAAFHAAIRRGMRTDQTPEHRTYGKIDPVFDAQRPFEI